MDTPIDKFEEIWRDFVDAFKGSLISAAHERKLTPGEAKLLFVEVQSRWLSEYTQAGRWLMKLIDSDRKRGMLVKEILTNDMKITPEPCDAGSYAYVKYGAPLGAAAVGFGVAKACGMTTVGTAIFTLIPLLIAMPMAKQYIQNKTDANINATINAYVRQLEKYHNSIVSTLLA